MAPLVNLVFIIAAVLTQLFLATTWGKAALECLSWKQDLAKEASSSQFDTNPEDCRTHSAVEPDTEHQRLLASAQLQGAQGDGVSEAQSAVKLEQLHQGPAALCIEMAGFDAVH